MQGNAHPLPSGEDREPRRMAARAASPALPFLTGKTLPRSAVASRYRSHIARGFWCSGCLISCSSCYVWQAVGTIGGRP
jgi:hypothetical protein